MLNKLKKNYKNILITLTVFILVVCITIGYYIYKQSFKSHIKLETTVIANVLKARQYITAFDYKTADIFYKKALEIEPSNENLLEEYLLFNVAHLNYNNAFNLAQQVVIKSPNHSLANIILTVNNIKNNDLNASINYLRNLSSEDNSINDILLKILESIQAYGEGNTELFEKLNAPIAVIMPDFYLYLYSVTALYYNDIDTATKKLSELNNTYPNIDAVIYYSKILYTKNKDEGINYFLEYLNDGFLSEKLVETYMSYKKDIDLQQIVSNVVLNLARLMSNEVNPNFLSSDSSILTNVALLINKDNNGAILSEASFYEEIGDYDTALQYYDTINNNSYYYRFSNVRYYEILISLDRNKEALRYLDNQILIDDRNPMPLLEAGQIYNKQGQYKKAILSYKKALQISEKHNYLLATWLSNFFIGIAYDKLGDWNKAEKALLVAKSLDNSDPLLLNYLAFSWINRDYNIEEALDMLKKALLVEPNNAAILDSYAWGLFKNKQYDEALQYAQKANNINPYDSLLSNHLGDILWQKGDYKAAKSYWGIALNLSTDKEQSKELQLKIDGQLPNYLDKETTSGAEASEQKNNFIETAKQNI